MTSTRNAVVAIAGGTAGGQLIALACSPVISRLVPPPEYGPFAVINATLLPLASVAALRLDAAIPVAEDSDEARGLAVVAARVVVIVMGIGLAATWWWGGRFARWLGIAGRPHLLLWAPIVAALMAWFAILNQLAIRWRQYGTIARRNVLQTGGTAVAQVVLGAVGWGADGMACGLAVGQAVGCISLLHGMRTLLASRDSHIAHRRSRSSLTKYKRFPLLLAPSALMNSLGVQAPILLVSMMFGATISGWIGMTQSILSLPLALVGAAMSQVFLGEFSAAKRSGRGDLMPMYVSASAKLFVVGLMAAVAILALGPAAFSFVLGGRWRTSGVYAQWLAVGMVLQIVASPLSQTLIVMGRLSWQMGWDFTRLTLSCLAICVPYWCGADAMTAIACLGGAMALSYAVLWFLGLMATKPRIPAATLPGSGGPPDASLEPTA